MSFIPIAPSSDDLDEGLARHYIDFLIDQDALSLHLAQLRSGERSNPSAVDLLALLATKAAAAAVNQANLESNGDNLGQSSNGAQDSIPHVQRKSADLRVLVARVVAEGEVPLSDVENRLPLDLQWLVIRSVLEFSQVVAPKNPGHLITRCRRWLLRAVVRRRPGPVLALATATATAAPAAANDFPDAVFNDPLFIQSLADAVRETSQELERCVPAQRVSSPAPKRAKRGATKPEVSLAPQFVELAEFQLFDQHTPAAVTLETLSLIDRLPSDGGESTGRLASIRTAVKAIQSELPPPDTRRPSAHRFFCSAHEANGDGGSSRPAPGRSDPTQTSDGAAPGSLGKHVPVSPLTVRSVAGINQLVTVADCAALVDRFLELRRPRTPTVPSSVMDRVALLLVDTVYNCVRQSTMEPVESPASCARQLHQLVARAAGPVPVVEPASTSPTGSDAERPVSDPLPDAAHLLLHETEMCMGFLGRVLPGTGGNQPAQVHPSLCQPPPCLAVNSPTPYVHTVGVLLSLLNAGCWQSCVQCVNDINGQRELVIFIRGLLHLMAGEGSQLGPESLTFLNCEFIPCLFENRTFCGAPLVDLVHNETILARLAGFLLPFSQNQLYAFASSGTRFNEFVSAWDRSSGDIATGIRCGRMAIEAAGENGRHGQGLVLQDGPGRSVADSWPVDPAFVAGLDYVVSACLRINEAQHNHTQDPQSERQRWRTGCLVALGMARASQKRFPGALRALVDACLLAVAGQAPAAWSRPQQTAAAPSCLLQNALTNTGLEQLIRILEQTRACAHGVVLCQFVEPRSTRRALALDLLRASNPMIDIDLCCVPYLFDVVILEHLMQMGAAAGHRGLTQKCMAQLKASNEHNSVHTAAAISLTMCVAFVQKELIKLR